jgi:tetratricopeptide (TPR) repeat protein
MSFLHSEFLLWLLLPTMTLFYFWLTQKPFQHRWMSDALLERLRAPKTTMGLKERNRLFLAASILLIVAMAQPVMMESKPSQENPLHLILAVDLSQEGFEQTRKLSFSTLYTLLGESIELVAFDEEVYRIAPRSNDGGILSELLEYLSPSAETFERDRAVSKIAAMEGDIIVVVSAYPLRSDEVWVVSSASDVTRLHEELLKQRIAQHAKAHIPLFYYPLGLAMVLILIALSSMSRRRSVSVASLLALLALSPDRSEAGIMDFQILEEAKSAYERGEYAKSETLYRRYQLLHDSPQVRYNRANALYKSGKFKQARFWYERVYTTDPVLKERTRYNLGLCIAKIATEEPAQSERKDDNVSRTEAREPIAPPLPTKRHTPLFNF